MSEMPQGPGWWLASDGRWYPPETAPPGLFEGAYPGYQAYYWDPASPTAPPTPGTVPPTEPAAPAVQTPLTPTTPVDDAPDRTTPTSSTPEVSPTAAGPSTLSATDTSALGEDPFATGGDPWSAMPPATPREPTVATQPSWSAPVGPAPVGPAPVGPAPVELTSRTTSDRWRPWLALLGVALLLWGAGQGLLAWAQWRLVGRQLASLGTVSQGHLGLALTAAGIVIAGLVTLVLSATLPRR